MAIRHKTEAPVAPEICVEVLSSSNTQAEMQEKRMLYFEKGAEEVWVCAESGDMHFYDASGPIDRSVIVSDFPEHVEMG